MKSPLRKKSYELFETRLISHIPPNSKIQVRLDDQPIVPFILATSP